MSHSFFVMEGKLSLILARIIKNGVQKQCGKTVTIREMLWVRFRNHFATCHVCKFYLTNFPTVTSLIHKTISTGFDFSFGNKFILEWSYRSCQYDSQAESGDRFLVLDLRCLPGLYLKLRWTSCVRYANLESIRLTHYLENTFRPSITYLPYCRIHYCAHTSLCSDRQWQLMIHLFTLQNFHGIYA